MWRRKNAHSDAESERAQGFAFLLGLGGVVAESNDDLVIVVSMW